ncbi:MAG: pyruvate kinase [Myxococcaceae bacterium]|nr:pyruvate kinase [Myxococcaceae bacterium]
MRKAKIVCTLGPASEKPEVIEGLIRAGMDVARFNFSHGTHEDHRRRLRVLQRAAQKVGRPVAVLQDIQGPKIRLGRFLGGQLLVAAGSTVTVTTRNVLGQGDIIPTPVRTLPKDVKKGDSILLDDGRVRLEVIKVGKHDVTAKVLVGGLLKDHKGLNLPGAAVSVPTLTKKDEEDLAFGQELGVDYVALSFVRTADDIRRARAHVARRRTPIIAKIEKPQAVENLEEIAHVADGVMVARGDLGVEMPLEMLPSIQKRIVETVNRNGGIAIVATEMLESMIVNARPTRAEVTDVANAVLDGADAVMLSGETASGAHPVAAAETMSRIVEETERAGKLRIRHTVPFESARDISTGVAAAAVAAAHQVGAELIVAYTESGNTARLISEFRPSAPILGLTPNEETRRRMALYWGVLPRVVGRLHSTDAMVRQVKRLCAEERLCPRGATVVVVAGVPLNTPGKTNMMSVHRI